MSSIRASVDDRVRIRFLEGEASDALLGWFRGLEKENGEDVVRLEIVYQGEQVLERRIPVRLLLAFENLTQTASR